MHEHLLIVGGSVRAAAMSARRSGFEPLAIDRFNDADLRQVCSEFRRYDELRELPELAQSMPVADWIYTGPLENHPELIDQLGKCRKLLGHHAATLRKLRDPWCVAAALGREGLQSPELGAKGQLPAGHDWLRKPLRAAGGFGITRSRPTRPTGDACGGSVYFQKFIAGRSIGATFLGARGRTVLIGVTEQLLGPSWGGSREFQYVGSVGPVDLPPEQAQALQGIGDCLAANFRVQGLYGVDAIVNDAGVWPVEVNPRYTASVEILERAWNVAVIRWHVAACRSGDLPDLARVDTSPEQRTLHGKARTLHGKAILYADRDILIDTRIAQTLGKRNDEAAGVLSVADIPAAGTRIQAGEPIVTVFSKGSTETDVKQGLRDARADVQKMLNAISRPA